MLKYLSKHLHTKILRTKQLKLLNKKHCTTRIYNGIRVSPNLKIQNRFLHLNSAKNVKVFIDSENSFAYRVLDSFPLATGPVTNVYSDKVISNETEFIAFLNQNWRCSTASEISKAFSNIVDYCRENNINISDVRFDKLVDGLMDNMEKLTTNELYTILDCVIKLPPTESHISHNFHDIWSALDDICCWRMKDWDLDTLYKFASLWYCTNLGRICDYVYAFVDKLGRKPERLSQQQLVHAFFYMNICRRRLIEFAYEDAVNRKLQTLTIDEMAVIAMAYFKSQTKVKLPTILNRMIELVIENSTTIHEISLAAILKTVRYSQNPETSTNSIRMLDKLTPEIHRLSHNCLTHVALLGTTFQILHEPTINAIAQKFIDDVHDIDLVRLKDIERLIFSTTMCDYDPKTTPDFYETLHKELHSKDRAHEKARHPKCVPCALSFLSTRNIYSTEVMNEILDPEFTKEVYGKSGRQLPRELYSLDLSKEIDLPNYTGNRWPPQMRQKAAKWLVEYLPDDNKKKLTLTEKFIVSVIDTVHKITGDKNLMHIGHVLPEYSKPDIILCVNKTTMKFVEPTGFHNYCLGDIMRPHDLENLKWFSVVSVIFNHVTKDTWKPLGIINKKKRHLEAVGYEPVLVMCHEFTRLEDDEKIDYILSKIKLQ